MTEDLVSVIVAVDPALPVSTLPRSSGVAEWYGLSPNGCGWISLNANVRAEEGDLCGVRVRIVYMCLGIGIRAFILRSVLAVGASFRLFLRQQAHLQISRQDKSFLVLFLVFLFCNQKPESDPISGLRSLYSNSFLDKGATGITEKGRGRRKGRRRAPRRARKEARDQKIISSKIALKSPKKNLWYMFGVNSLKYRASKHTTRRVVTNRNL